MKQYKILASSLTTHLGVQLKQGEEVGENRFLATHIADLISGKMIEEVTAPEEAKSKKKD